MCSGRLIDASAISRRCTCGFCEVIRKVNEVISREKRSLSDAEANVPEAKRFEVANNEYEVKVAPPEPEAYRVPEPVETPKPNEGEDNKSFFQWLKELIVTKFLCCGAGVELDEIDQLLVNEVINQNTSFGSNPEGFQVKTEPQEEEEQQEDQK